MNSDQPLSVMIVDDEMLARSRLRDLLQDIRVEVPNEVIAEAVDGLEAVMAMEKRMPDVMLIDIRMPKMDGIELARHLCRLDTPPAVIFVTAYDNYAVQAFELNAIDYLVKPVRAQRLTAALQKAGNNRPLAAQVLADLQKSARSHLSCHDRGRLLLIPLEDVLYLKADMKYVMARTIEREYLLDESLTHLEQEFAERFIRLHRGALAAKEAIVGFEKGGSDEAESQWQVLLRGIPEKLAVSRRQWPVVKLYAKQLSV